MSKDLTKQELARKRNWFKFQITGIPLSKHHIDERCLHEDEKLMLEELRLLLQTLNHRFERYSRELGLKVPEHRCWCGKEGKYPVNIALKYTHPNLDFVCFKHKE